MTDWRRAFIGADTYEDTRFCRRLVRIIHRFFVDSIDAAVYKYSLPMHTVVQPACRPASTAAARTHRAARVAVAGATGYTGQELLRLLARHPAVTITAATSSGATGARGACRRWRRIWNGTITPLDRRDALAREADVVFLALPDKAAAELAPALVDAGRPRHRPVGRVPAARRGRARAVVSGNAPRCRRPGLRPHRARARRRRAARAWWPTPAAIRRRRCSPSRRSRPRACSPPAPTSSSTRSPACRAPARRRPSGRISRKCTAAWPPTACSAIVTARKSNRASPTRRRDPTGIR